MKKTLYSTTFLATAGVLALGAGDAFAQAAAPAAEKLKLSLGGYMIQYAGYAKQSDRFTDAQTNAAFAVSATTGAVGSSSSDVGWKHFDVKNDSEVYFNGSLALDNGLTVAVVNQLETQRSSATGSDWIDESYLRVISPTLGELKLGSMDPLSNALSPTAPFIGIRYNNADQNVWIIAPTDVRTANTTAIGGGDNNRVGYYTPTIWGFRLGGSYTPSTTNEDTQPKSDQAEELDVALMWEGAVMDFKTRVGAGWWRNTGNAATSNHDNYRIGADVTFADITIGGSYLARFSHMGDSGTAGGSGANAQSTAETADLYTWDVGIAYRPGPFGVALTYLRSVADATRRNTQEDKQTRWTLGANYVIGPGVQLVGNYLRHSYSEEADTASLENTGWAVVGGIQVDF